MINKGNAHTFKKIFKHFEHLPCNSYQESGFINHMIQLYGHIKPKL